MSKFMHLIGGFIVANILAAIICCILFISFFPLLAALFLLVLVNFLCYVNKKRFAYLWWNLLTFMLGITCTILLHKDINGVIDNGLEIIKIISIIYGLISYFTIAYLAINEIRRKKQEKAEPSQEKYSIPRKAKVIPQVEEEKSLDSKTYIEAFMNADHPVTFFTQYDKSLAILDHNIDEAADPTLKREYEKTKNLLIKNKTELINGMIIRCYKLDQLKEFHANLPLFHHRLSKKNLSFIKEISEYGGALIR